MNRLVQNRLILVSSSVAMLGFNAIAAPSPKQSLPNVIFILADDLGYGDISALNESSKIQTSNIDAMANKGIIFTDAHAGSSVSTPSRYGIMTGRYAFRTYLRSGVIGGNSKPLIHYQRPTIANMLANCGYETACIGKWHLGWNWAKTKDEKIDFNAPITHGPTQRGFDYFYGINSSLDMPPYVYIENNLVTAAPNRIAKERKGLELFREGPIGADFEPETCFTNLAQKSIDYLQSPERKQSPFFLYIPLTAPHTPILPTPEFQGKSGLSPYGDFVLMVDHFVGQVRSTLDKMELSENTIIIFSSDNGCAPYADMKGMEQKGHKASYIFRGSKSDIYDGGHRIPLIISWANHYNGEKNKNLISLTDLYATFAQMGQVKLADNVAEDSFSLWPIMTGKASTKRKYAVHHSNEGYFSIRDSRWKLIFCGGSGGWSYPTTKDLKTLGTMPNMQLYDMIADPAETRNLVNENPQIVERMKKQMKEFILNGRSTPGAVQANDISDKWPQTELFIN